MSPEETAVIAAADEYIARGTPTPLAMFREWYEALRKAVYDLRASRRIGFRIKAVPQVGTIPGSPAQFDATKYEIMWPDSDGIICTVYDHESAVKIARLLNSKLGSETC